MIDLDFIQALIRAVDESSLDNVEIERGGTRIRLSKTADGAGGAPVLMPGSSSETPPAPAPPAPAPAPVAVSEAPAAPEPGGTPHNWVDVKSPMVGTFYRAPSPGAEPFTDVGRRVSPGDALCIIEAMKLMNELEAEVTGTVREVLVENGEPVEYGQVLFRVEPA
ncbi:MAG: acetyl-CoA carboxylase biotin carboxyl carrier protein [Gemmatimonadales bacterium]|nr:MAG: acetyl-CoA carboxylase biotin carboxyl carrier protein [Gemmatimonadales bacterium]